VIKENSQTSTSTGHGHLLDYEAPISHNTTEPTLYANPNYARIANQRRRGKEKERIEEANLKKIKQYDFTIGPKIEPLACNSIPKTHTLRLNQKYRIQITPTCLFKI